MRDQILSSVFGTLADGRTVDKYTLTNEKGMSVEVITYGGIITAIQFPNRKGKVENVVLGFDNLQDYVTHSAPYFGAIVGRCANRIGGARFSLLGKEYKLASNIGNHHLHGGIMGFDKAIWKASSKVHDKSVSLSLTYLSKDGEEGYPGNLLTEVIYTLTEENTLEVHYKATTDKTTVINLTQHSYFNLSGNHQRDILDHELQIDADRILSVDTNIIPTGELVSVKETPFDFNSPKTIGRDINVSDSLLQIGLGYDHCYVFNKPQDEFRTVASVFHPSSGRSMQLATTEPAVQLYTANYLQGTHPRQSGFCLETQHYPDSPNKPSFPPITLEPSQEYHSKTEFKFSILS